MARRITRGGYDHYGGPVRYGVAETVEIGLHALQERYPNRFGVLHVGESCQKTKTRQAFNDFLSLANEGVADGEKQVGRPGAHGDPRIFHRREGTVRPLHDRDAVPAGEFSQEVRILAIPVDAGNQ